MAPPRRRPLLPRSAPRAAARPPAPALAEELGTLVGRTRRLLRAEAERRVAARGESLVAWQLLKHLVRSGPATQVELAQAIAQDPAGISRLLEPLEEAGAVRRVRDPVDRRRLVASATARGRKRFLAVTPSVVEGFERLLETLEAAEVLELRRILRKLLGDAAGPS